MPNPFFTKRTDNTDTNEPESRLTAIIEIHEIDELIENQGIGFLQKFYQGLACEVYNQRVDNYGLGLRAIEPEFQIFLGKIVITTSFFLEKNLPDLSSVIFKHFIDYCNLVLATAIKEGIAVTGLANIGNNYLGSAYSSGTRRAPSKESLIMSDLLNIFTFDEIFPHGFGQKVIPPVCIPYFFGEDLTRTGKNLSSIKEIGVFMPYEIKDYPATEVAILAGMLETTEINSNKIYSCNWKSFFEKNIHCLSIDEIMENLKKLSEGDNESAMLWKRVFKS